jgi:hypothetical protein
VPGVLAIISKAVYEKDAKLGGRVAGVGDVVPLARYVSKNKGLTPVAEGGSLFLVTVRPPDEALWLVAILEAPSFDGENWNSAPNKIPVTNVSAIKDKVKFANGAGISAKKGALGMSLQTPRVLSDADVALLRSAGGAPAPAAGSSAGASAPAVAVVEKGHLNAHEGTGAAPCLCRKCLPQAPDRFVAGNLALVRDRASADGRFVWYWLPEALASSKDAIRRSVESRLHARARKARKDRGYEDLDALFAGEDGDDE